MSFTYTYDPKSNPLDYGRFLIGDTVESGHILEDTEIEYILAQYTDSDGVLDELRFKAAIFRHTATRFALKPNKRSLGPQAEEYSKRLAYFMAEADKAEKDLMFTGTPPLPNYQYPKVFDKHMMANKR